MGSLWRLPSVAIAPGPLIECASGRRSGPARRPTDRIFPACCQSRSSSAMFIADSRVVDRHRLSVKRITIRRRDGVLRQFLHGSSAALTNLQESRVRNDRFGHGSPLNPFDVAKGRITQPYTTLTFSPRGPFGPCPRSKVTACPSRSSSKEVSLHAELWKKYSFPSLAKMNPNPLSLTRRFIVPFRAAIVPSLESQAAGLPRSKS